MDWGNGYGGEGRRRLQQQLSMLVQYCIYSSLSEEAMSAWYKLIARLRLAGTKEPELSVDNSLFELVGIRADPNDGRNVYLRCNLV